MNALSIQAKFDVDVGNVRVSNPTPGFLEWDPTPSFRFLVWDATNLGKSTEKSAWDRQEGGCHSPLPKLRYGRFEERANIRAYKTCVQAQRPESRESHVTGSSLSVAGGAPSHTKEKPVVVR